MLLCYQTTSELDTVLGIYNFEKQILSLLLYFLPSVPNISFPKFTSKEKFVKKH